MADLSSILGGMVQGFKDFGTGLVDMFGTGGAAIGDLFQSGGRSTKNQDDFRKWLYQTDNTQDAAAKGLGTILNGVQTVSDFIPGAGAVTRNPLFNGVQGAIGGVADEFKMAGKDYDLGRAAQRAGVGAASGLASAYTNQALSKTGNKLINNGLVRGAAGGALAGGIANAGYTGIEGGSVQDMINAGLYGAQTGALVGGTTGLARELIKPTTKMDAALTNKEKAARIANIDDQLAKLDTSTPEGSARYNELMAARDNYANDKMIRLYRGMSAEDVPTLKQYYDDMRNPEIQPKQYSGASLNGRGYDTAPDFRTAESYAEVSGNGPSMGVFEIDLPEESFVPMTKELGNRETDFIIRAHDKFGGYNPEVNPKYNPEALAIGKQDFQNYLKTNNIAGSVNPDKSVYTIMNSDVVGDFRASKMLPQAQNYLETNGYASLDDVPNPKTVADLMVESRPKTYYHGSPETDITEFDMGRAGKNTRSGEKAIYFTDDPATAEEFSYERTPTDSLFFDKKGRKGGVYEANLDMKNTLDLGNLSDAQIEELWQYASPLGKLDGKEGFIKDMKHLRQVGNDQLIKSKLDLSALANSPYDSFQAKMYPGENDIREYGIFDASKAKITKSPKTVADLMLSPDDDIMYSKVAEGQLGLFDQPMPKPEPEPVALPKSLGEQASLFDQPKQPIVEAQLVDTEPANPYAPVDGQVTQKMRDRAADVIKNYAKKGVPDNELYNMIDESTLPAGYKEFREIVDSGKSYAKEKLGAESANKADLRRVVEYLYDDTAKQEEMLRNVKIEESNDAARRAMYGLAPRKSGSSFSEKMLRRAADEKLTKEFTEKIGKIENRVPELINSLRRYNPSDLSVRKGLTAAADEVLSERLGIAPGNTIKYNGPADVRSAYGRYSKTAKNLALTKSNVADPEQAVSTMAHERLHAFQNEADLNRGKYGATNRYDKRVTDAFDDLRKDLEEAKVYKSYPETAERYGSKDAEYFYNTKEQEARMLQQYLNNKGYADLAELKRPNTGKSRSGEFGTEVNAAFDKFFDKLRALSKKGVALPAITALFGGGAIAGALTSGKDDKKKKSEVK